jgi:hypothetical protein
MISKTLTSLKLNDTLTKISINDTFICNSDISFICPLASLNSLLVSSISSLNISNFKFYVRICDQINGSTVNNIRFSKIYNLSSLNIVNSYFHVNFKDLSDNISHDYLMVESSENEIKNLFKSFKIIFRIFSGTLTNENTVESNDFVQDLNIVLNTIESGPYEVKHEIIDVLNSNDFAKPEIIDELTKNIRMAGGEIIRAYYPKNIQDLSAVPILVMVPGAGHFVEDYDHYLSHIASYGYFCFCGYLEVYDGPNSASAATTVNVLPTNLIRLLDHLKRNKLKINSSLLSNVNFNKIICMGHSRGGLTVEAVPILLQKKNTAESVLSDITIAKDDILCIISIAGLGTYCVGDDGKILSLGTIAPVSIKNIQESMLNYFQKFTTIPFLHIRAQNDTDSNNSFAINTYTAGFCYDTKRIITDVQTTVHSYFSHEDLRGTYVNVRNSESNANQYPETRNDEVYNYNTTIVGHSYLISEIIKYISIVNGSNKLKKLRYHHKNTSNPKVISDKQNPLNNIYFANDNDVLYYIDNFMGSTFSLAGATGFTFNCPGFGYTYGLDPVFSDEIISFGAGVTFLNAFLEGKIDRTSVGYDAVVYDKNGFTNLTYKVLYLPIEANCTLGYTFTTSLGLTEDNYIALKGALKYFPSYNGNTFDAKFSLTLYDNNNNNYTINSSQYDGYFLKPPCLITGETGGILYTSNPPQIPSMPTTVFFRAGDFYLNNLSLDLNNIKQIFLKFGPDYGSTFAHLALDEFVIMKKL